MTAKLTEKQVRKAHALYMKGLTTRQVAEQVGASPDAIGHVRGGTNWRHLGLGPVPAKARARPGGQRRVAPPGGREKPTRKTR